MKFLNVDEYKLSTLYTAGALTASAAYEVYDNQYDVPDQSLARDMILGFFYAAILSVMMSLSKEKRHKLFTSIGSLLMWLGRLVCGIMMSSFSDLYTGEDNSLIYWCITGFGVASSMGSLIGMYIRHRREKREGSREIEPVKLRFMA
jgi:hypothetical protein